MSAAPKCRSCGAEVLWIILRPSGKRHPIDPAPSEAGTIRLRSAEVVDQCFYEAAEGVVLSKAARGDYRYHGELFTSHFATCPDADNWRRKT